MHRFIHIEMNLSINDYLTNQNLSLEETLTSINHRIDQLNQFIQIAKTKCHFPSEHNLTRDESAAIYLYTMEWDNNIFHRILQQDLHSKDSTISQVWFPYLQLFNTAMQKLPNTQISVWRGLNEDICKNWKIDDKFILCNPISCSLSENIIKESLGSNSILCSIEVINGKDISIYSHFPNQKEIILSPGTSLQVIQDQTSSKILHLRECDRQTSSSSSSITINTISKILSLQWHNNRLISFVPHCIALLLGLILVILTGKTMTTFDSSFITTLMTTSYYQVIQAISSSKIQFSRTTIFPKPSNIYIEVDTYGNRYEGEWLDGKKHGKGKMDFANGYKYTGDWIDDTPTGNGIFIWTNGDQYEGEIKQGQRHGKGSYLFANGDKYIGDWFEDKKYGYGISSLAVGRYEGEFKDDKMHGKGTFYFSDGGKYIGDWIDNKQEGEGIFSWPNGDRYEGEFKGGKLHGHGSYYLGNGNKFVGDWIDGERMTDHGAFTWANIRRSEEEKEEKKKDDQEHK